MNKISCDIIKDILPLYYDNICSDDSKKMVEEHLAECNTCKSELDKIKTDIKIPKETIEKNISDSNAIKNISAFWNRSKVKAFIKGVIITAISFTVIFLGYIGLFQWNIVSVPTDVVEITNVCELTDGRIAYHVKLTDGYDLRHLASMSTSVVVKNIIVDLYIDQIKEKRASVIETIAKKEIEANENEIFKYKIILVSDLVCCSGNALKFFIPPTRGNITALNLPEWISLLQDSLISIKYEFRDKKIERIIFNRETINDNWIKLIGNIENGGVNE